MSRTLVGTGNAVSDETDVFSAPLVAYQRPQTVPGAIWCHASLHTATSQTDRRSLGAYPIYDAMRQLWCVGMGDFGFDSWGNDTAIADVLAFQTWMQSTMVAKPGKVALLGASMGVVTALNYAYAHPENVACVALFNPAVSPPSYPNATVPLNAAYGGTYDDAVDGPTHNPMRYAADFPPSIPVQLWYSTADTVAFPQFVEQFADTCPSATATVCSTTLDHGELAIAAVPVGDVLAFISASLS